MVVTGLPPALRSVSNIVVVVLMAVGHYRKPVHNGLPPSVPVVVEAVEVVGVVAIAQIIVPVLINVLVRGDNRLVVDVVEVPVLQVLRLV